MVIFHSYVSLPEGIIAMLVYQRVSLGFNTQTFGAARAAGLKLLLASTVPFAALVTHGCLRPFVDGVINNI